MKLDPRLRLVSGRVVFLPNGKNLKPVALYRGYQYCGFTLSSSYVEKKTKNTKVENTWNKERGMWLRKITSYPTRGRDDFLRLLFGKRIIHGRAQTQFLRLWQ
jgi:hypothetical protein